EDCSIPGRYTTIEIDPQRELARIGSERSESGVGESQTWELVTSSMSRAIVPVGSSDYLEGHCDGATHVVRAIAFGAARRRSVARAVHGVATPPPVDILLDPLAHF